MLQDHFTRSESARAIKNLYVDCTVYYTDGLKVNDAKTNLDAGEIESIGLIKVT